ncbi:MAG: SgcJ/EcaC family oxidoreductase [Planctomycetota bacterium]
MNLRPFRNLIPILILHMSTSMVFGQPAAPAKSAWNDQQKQVVEAIDRYTLAFNKLDTKLLASFFSDDARLVGVDGAIFEGRDAILGLFQEGFRGNPGLKMTNDVRNIRILSDTVAIEEGFSSTTTEVDKKPSVVAYHVVHVKRDGHWVMFDIFETAPVEDPSENLHSERLAGLDTIVGEWVEETESATIRHSARWSPSHNYLLIDYIAETGTGKPKTIATQRVGWDKKSKSIRSWLFEEDGGHGTALWTPETVGKGWKLRGEAVLSDGRVVTGTTVFDASKSGQITIRSYDRTADGEAIEDATIRLLVRKPPSLPANNR